jgi:hypothetical protein
VKPAVLTENSTPRAAAPCAAYVVVCRAKFVEAVSDDPPPDEPVVGVVTPPKSETLPLPVLGVAVPIFPGVIVLKFHCVMMSALADETIVTNIKLANQITLIRSPLSEPLQKNVRQ